MRSHHFMKIYTKTGDEGLTSLLSGKRVGKMDQRLAVYGTTDELNSFVGLLISGLKSPIPLLTEIQHSLFNLGSLVACDDPVFLPRLAKLENHAIQNLETQMDLMQGQLPALKNFILPGGSLSASHAHLCRTIARRAERELAQWLSENPEPALDINLLVYLNRLSDYFFVLARWLNQEQGQKDQLWIP
jgi:cob(I)alamin adenosyltransferase